MNKIKILLVDDHQIVRDGIKRILLEENDFELVKSLGSGEQALEFLKNNQTDVVIADISMPGISGLDLTEKITAQFPEIKVLVLSMFNNEDYILSAVKAGAKGYLSKQDSSTEILVKAIRTIINGDDYFSPSISKILTNSYISNVKFSRTPEASKATNLTLREKEILKYYAEGLSNEEIAEKLHISISTVKTHKNNIMQKYNFKSNVDMIKFALRNKIVEW